MSLAVFRARLAMAEFAIRQLHARYADACWRKDADAMRALFAADGVWDFSSGPQRGGDAIARFLGGGFGHYRHICVTMGTPIVSLSGERAAARTYLVEQGLLADGAPYRTVGHYAERFVEEGARWLFAWRQFQPWYSGPPDMRGGFADLADPGPPA